MRSLFLILLLAGCQSWGPAPETPRNPASEVDTRLLGERLAVDRFFLSSTKIPQPLEIRVIRPRNLQPNEQLPVLYFLHGRGASASMFEDLGFWSDLESNLDLPFGRVLVVAPQGGWNETKESRTLRIDTYWADSALSQGPQIASTLIHELIPEIERRYPVHPGSHGRHLSGISMGGGGSFQIALNFPGHFRCVVGHSAVFRSYESAIKDFPHVYGTKKADYEARDPVNLVWKRVETSAETSQQAIPFSRVFLHMGGAEDRAWLARARDMEQFLRRLGYTETRGDVFDIGRRFPEGQHNADYWRTRFPETLHWLRETCFP